MGASPYSPAALTADLFKIQLANESHAAIHNPTIKPPLEPFLPLSAVAMRPALCTHLSSAHLLQVIVAHFRRCSQRAGDVIFMNDVPLLCAVPPYSCKAVGLQLQVHRQRILFALILLREP